MHSIKTKLKKGARTPKGRIIGFSILIFLILAITGGIWYWNTNKRAIIKNKLETAVREKSKGLYKIKYDSLAINEIAGYMSISNMSLAYDSTRYTDLKKTGKEPSFLLDIFIPEISVSGLKTPRALIENEIAGRKLEIRNPVIHITYTSGKKSGKTLPQQELYEQLLGDLDLIQADTILISGAQINTNDRKTKKTMEMKDVSITLVNVKVDSTSNADSSRFFFAKESSMSSGKISWSSADKLYNYTAGNLSVSSESRLLRIKSFRAIPTLNEDAFVKALPAQGDRFDISLNNIEMHNVALPLLFEGNVIADNIRLPGTSIKIYRDLSIPRDTKNRVGEYPHQLMQTIPFTFRVKKIVMTNSFIEYKEKHHISEQTGKVQYYSVNATISNFTNDKKAIAANNIMTVDMSSRFLDKAPFTVNAQFYLLDPKGRFKLKGSFGAMDATLLNPVIEKTGMTSVKTGKVNGAEFKFEGDDHNIDGTVKMLYEDLKVAALERDIGSTELDKKSITSFIANIIIKNSNPKKNDEVRVAQVTLERNTNRTFFNFAWKALLKGVTQSVGLKK